MQLGKNVKNAIGMKPMVLHLMSLKSFLSNGILNNARIHITVEELQKFIDAINALEQEPKTEQFAKWVATEIFDDMWEYNKDSFAEIACHKLAKLGIVRAKSDEWELVESEASE